LLKVDEMFDSDKKTETEVRTDEENEEEDEEFRPKPKLQQLTFLVKSFWPDWWGKK